MTGEIALLAGQTEGVKDLPVGTVVTLREKAPEPVGGLRWEAPVFSGPGVQAADGAATLTITRGTTAEVMLVNPIAVVRPPVGGFTVTKESPERGRRWSRQTGSSPWRTPTCTRGEP
ncbi:DUF5979 domain-containing protein [Microbacterium sp. 1S1]|uniref:DUF5979 domain-containing protein n=1 Tax=Microbacterium sp. 1S1 TaxID=2606451 RepID=UPI001CA41742